MNRVICATVPPEPVLKLPFIVNFRSFSVCSKCNIFIVFVLLNSGFVICNLLK